MSTTPSQSIESLLWQFVLVDDGRLRKPTTACITHYFKTSIVSSYGKLVIFGYFLVPAVIAVVVLGATVLNNLLA